MLTGTLPFREHKGNVMELIRAHISGEVPKVRNDRSDVPSDIGCVVEKLLQKDPNDRFQSACGLWHQLSAIQQRRREERERERERKEKEMGKEEKKEREGKEEAKGGECEGDVSSERSADVYLSPHFIDMSQMPRLGACVRFCL